MFKNQLKIAWRSLFKRKVFASINIMGLAIGFGCAIVIFLFVSHHLAYDTFHEKGDRIVRFVTEEKLDGITYSPSVPPGFPNAFKSDYAYAEKTAKHFQLGGEQLIAVESRDLRMNVSEEVGFVEADFFSIFDFPFLEGSPNAALENPNTAVMTEAMAQKLFGRANAIGETFLFNNRHTITVTGILKPIPATTDFKSSIFISFKTPAFAEFVSSESWDGIWGNLMCFGLLRPNQDLDAIEAAIAAYPDKYRPDSKNKHTYHLQPLSTMHHDARYGGQIPKSTLWIFSLIGVFILGMACINFINISTGQSVYRSKEVGMRKVVGGVKSQLFWQFMVETFLTSLLALITGIGLSALALPWFNAIFDLSLSLSGLLDPAFLGFAMLLLALVTFFAGSYPGILITRVSPVLALKNQLSSKDIGGSRTRKGLVIAQFTIAIMLIAGTLVVNKQLDYALTSDLGYNQNGVLMLRVPPTQVTPIQLEGLKERLSKINGVQSVSRCLTSPGATDMTWGTAVRYNNNPEDEEFSIQLKAADSDYLNTFEIPLLAGRNYIERDSVYEVVVNATFAKKVGVSDPSQLLGKNIALFSGSLGGTIVGVVEDFHDRSFEESINPVFMVAEPDFYGDFALKLNTEQLSETLTGIEKEWTDLFPAHIFNYTFLDDRVAQQYEAEQRFLSLSKVFSILAILIGCLGVYGLISFFVTQKTKEIGIRKVLGSNLAQILSLLAKDFVAMILVSGAIATPIAYLIMGRWLENYTFKTELSWWIFALAIGGMVGIAMATITYKALKAARVNPITSLRTE
ncbi:ABC transporter permease [Flagellimonas sp. DF-77]|uniref:ABC transporter permease n=1 Tax=Flagellimonas algarum TaxID=3230298 RepID=UPI0033958850